MKRYKSKVYSSLPVTRFIKSAEGAALAEKLGLNPYPGVRIETFEERVVAHKQGWLLITSISNRELKSMGLLTSSQHFCDIF